MELRGLRDDVYRRPLATALERLGIGPGWTCVDVGAGGGDVSVALAEIVLAVEHPAETAARFSVLAGRPVVPDPEGGFQLDLPRGKVRMLPPEAVGQVFPGIGIPCLPFIAGIKVRTDDAARAASVLLAERSVPYRRIPDGILVESVATGGVALLLT